MDEVLQRRHNRNHSSLVSMDVCWECTKQKAKCASKLFRWPDRDSALAEVKQMNQVEDYATIRVAYWCRWCGLYHMTSKPRGKVGRGRVTKEKRRWLAQKETLRRKQALDQTL